MKDILFVNVYDHIKKQGFEPPIGLISLSETLDNIGMESEIMDFQYMYNRGEFQLPRNMNEYISKMCSCILEKGIRLISFYTMCSNLHIVVRVAEVLKKQDSSLLIGVGGPQATVTADAIMERYSWIDFVGLGEGETSIQSIVNIMHSEKSREDGIAIKGLVYRNKHGIVNGGLPEMIENLDELPILRYKGFDISGLDSLSLDVGRGCPFSCTFCSTKSFWKRRYRIKSPSRLVSEMEYYYNNFQIKQFSLQHDMLTADKDAVLKLCDLLKQKKLDITWVCSARIDMLDTALVQEMLSAGCVGVFIGIESGSQEIQRKINKNLDLHKTTENIIRFSNMGLNMALSFIYGFPEETEKDIEDTLQYIYKLVQYAPAVKKRLQLHRLSFFAGTELTIQNFHMLEYDITQNHTMSYSSDRIYSADELPKGIFPHFYKLKTNYINEFADLDNFVMLIMLKTLKGYEGTYKTLVGSQDLSLIELYRKYARYEKESGFYKKVGFYNVADMDEKAVLEEFYRFVKSTWSDTPIATVTEIEHEINRYMYSENCDERLLWSEVDYLRVKKYGCLKVSA